MNHFSNCVVGDTQKNSYSHADPTRPKLPAICRGHAYFCVPKLSGFTKLAHFLSARLPTFFCYPCATTFSATISNSTKIFENLSCWIYETERHDLRDLSERPWEASPFAVAAVGPRCAVPTVEAMNFSLGSPQRLRRRTYGLISTNGAFAQQYLC
jgi:hypothetical protein